MSDQFWLTKAQLKRIKPFFPRSRGVPRVDDRRVVSSSNAGLSSSPTTKSSSLN
jgi:transposase